MVCDLPSQGQRPLSVTRRGGFFEDPFFRDAWGDYSHAVRKIVDRFNHGWLGEQRPSSVGRDEATPHYHSVYRSLRAARMSYASHSTKFKEEGDVYKMVMDVREFVGGDVTVRTAGGTVSVRGKLDTSLQNPVVRHIDRSRRRKERDQKGRSAAEDDSDADSTASGASTSTKTLQRRFTLPADADGEKVHSSLSKDAILTVTIPKRNDVRVIPVTLESDRQPSPEKSCPSPERGLARLKRPSTSEPASPVPSKRSQDASGEPRRGSTSRGPDSSLNGGPLPSAGANGFNAYENIRGDDGGGSKGEKEHRRSSKTVANGVLDELETSSDATGARREGSAESGAERRGSSSRSRSRRNSKYEEAREVVIPIRISGKKMTNGVEESSTKECKENKVYDIKIHREGASDRNKETNKENESPKKRKSFTYINGNEADLKQANGYHISDKRPNSHIVEGECNSTDRKSREIKIANIDYEPKDGKSSPKTFYYFGEPPKEAEEANPIKIRSINLKENSLSDKADNKSGQKDPLPNGCVETILNSLRSKKHEKEETGVDCSSSESGMSTNSGTLSAKTNISSTSSAPSTSSDYGTPTKALTLSDSPTFEQNSINKSYKRKITTPNGSPKIFNGSVNSKVTPSSVYKLKNARNAEDFVDEAEASSDEDSQKAKRKIGHSAPPSPPFGKEVKVEHRQSLLEDDMFKDCWRDYSNTLQDVLSRLQELSTELGQTPKFLVSSPSMPEVSLPGSTDTTPSSKPSYQFAATPEAGAGSSSAALRGSPWARNSTVMGGRYNGVGVDNSFSSPATTSDTSASTTVTSAPSIPQRSSLNPPRVDATASHQNIGSDQKESRHLSAEDHQVATPWWFRNNNEANSDHQSNANGSGVSCASRPPPLSLSSFPDGGCASVGAGRHRPTSLHLHTNQDGPLLRKLRINSPVEALQERYFNQMAPSSKVSSIHLSGDVHHVPVEVDGATRNSDEGARGVTATVGGPSSSTVSGGGKAPVAPGATSRQSQVTGGGGNNTGGTAANTTRHTREIVGQRGHGTAAFPPTYHLGEPYPPSSQTRPTSSSLLDTTGGSSRGASDSHHKSISVTIDRVVGSGGGGGSCLVSRDTNLPDGSVKGSLTQESSGSVCAGVVSAGESVVSVSASGLEEPQEGAWSDSRSPTGAGGGAPDAARVRPHLPSARSAGLEKDPEGAPSGLCLLNNEDAYSKGDSNRDPKTMDSPLLASKHSDYAAPSTRSLGSPILNLLAEHRPHSWAQETAPAPDHPKTGIALDAERIIEQTRKLSSTTLNNLDSPAQAHSKSEIYNKKRFNFESSDMSRVSPESNTSIEDDSLEEVKTSSNEDTSKEEGIVQGRLSFPIERLRQPDTSPSKRGVSKAEQEQAVPDVTSWSRPLAAHQTRIQSDDVTAATVERPRQPLPQSSLRQTVNEPPTCRLHQFAQPDMGGVFSKGRTRGASQPPTVSTTPCPPVASQASLRSPRLRDRAAVERPIPPYVSQKSEPPRRYSGFSHVTSDNVRRMRDVWGSRQEKPPAPPPPAGIPPGTPPHTRKQTGASRTAPSTPRYSQPPPGSPFTPRRTASPSTPQRSPSPAAPRRKPTAVPSAVSERMEKRAPSPSPREKRAPSPSPREKRAPSPSPREKRTPSPSSRERRALSPIPRDKRAPSPNPREKRAASPSPRDRRAASPSPRTRGSSSPAGKHSSSASASPSRMRSTQSPSFNSNNNNSTHDSSENSRYRNPRSSSANRASSSPEKSQKSPSPTKSDPRLPRKTGTPPTTPTRKTFPSQPYGSPSDRINGNAFNNNKTPSSPRSSPRTSPPHTNTNGSSYHKCRSSPSRDTRPSSKNSPARAKPRAPSAPSTTTGSTSYHQSTTANTSPFTTSHTTSTSKTKTSTSSPSPRTRTTGSSEGKTASSEHKTAPSAHKRIYKRFRDASLRPDSETLCFVEQDDRYKMVLDVAEFVSGEIEVLQDDKMLTVKGSVETQEGEGQSAVRTFHRTFSIPQNSKEEDIDSALSEDGFLTIFVPKKRERVIKIELVD